MEESFVKTTEQDSLYRFLEKDSVSALLEKMNNEDLKVAVAVKAALPQVNKLIEAVVGKLANGGRLFYIGAGTSGRLGVLDASECVPTFGVAPDKVMGIIAGGKMALTTAVENAEDNEAQGWNDLSAHHVSSDDIVIGLASSGTTPYVLSAVAGCSVNNIVTGCITCNKNAPLARAVDFPVEVVVGPEFITGSTRLKSGTATKMVLNMISTIAMIKIGKVKDNKMVHMQLSNKKVIDRGTKMLMQILEISDYARAKKLLETYGSVANAVAANRRVK